MGVCLDLTTRRGTIAVEAAFKDFEASMKTLGEPLPQNKDPLHTSGDQSLRFLDRAVLTHLKEKMKAAGIRDYDTLRALFPEGNELYPGSGFLKKTHVQIAVRNMENIRGIFRVPAHELQESGIPESIYGLEVS